MKLAITGHRPNKLGNEYDLKGPITSRIKKAIEQILDREKPDTLITGMALGVDQLFALIGIEHMIPVIAAIPCVGHPDRWPVKSRDVYWLIMKNPLVTTHYMSDNAYTHACMQERNIWMVDNCDKIIAVWDGTLGGTANCVEYANEVGREIIRIQL